MSFRFYGKLWLATTEDLQDLLLREKVAEKLTPTKDSLFAHRVLASLYARYVILCNKLSDIYDQTLQVQKRQLLEKILTAASNRLLELQKHLRKIELSEFIYVDQTLHELKVIPQDVQILRPFHFPLRREQIIQDLLDGVADSPQIVEQPVFKQGLDRFRPVLTAEQQEVQRVRQVFVATVNLIKAHEKARQARVYLGNIRRDPEKYWPQPPVEALCHVPYEFYHREDQWPLIQVKRTHYRTDFRLENPIVLGRFSYYEPPSTKKDELRKSTVADARFQVPEVVVERKSSAEQDTELRQALAITALNAQQDKAATVIQRAFHRYRLKKRMAVRKFEKLKFFRMVDDRKYDFSMTENIEKCREHRRSKKASYDTAFLQAVEDERVRIVKLKSPWIMEDISDHIRAWFREFYDKAGDFDRYPTALEGGTILVLRGETATVEEFIKRKKERELEKKKSKEQKKKEREAKKAARAVAKEKLKAEKARLKELKRLKKEKEKKEGVTYDFSEPEFKTKALIDLDQSMAEYETEWRFIDEMKNVYETPIDEWISLDKFAEIHVELRPIVDEFMRMEHELLLMALAKDQGRKFKKPKEKKQRKKRQKKKRVPKDITADKSTEELYVELKEMQVIRKYEKRTIDELVGDLNFTAYDKRNVMEESPLHCLGDVRDAIRSCLLGLGPQKVAKPKSLCIAGPPQCGQKLLADAICSEVDAVCFDLSPPIIANLKCDLKYFGHLVLKMARLLQPTVLFIDGAHKPFYRKIPREEKAMDPRKLGKILIKKIVKMIKPEDKVLLLGITDQPWNSKLGKMKKCWERILLLPGVDYGSGFLMWRTELLRQLGMPRDVVVSPLALVAQGYGTGRMKECVDAVVDLRRRMRFSRQPLQLEELYENLLAGTPALTAKELDKYPKWYKKVSALEKQRAKRQKLRDAEKLKEAKKK